MSKKIKDIYIPQAPTSKTKLNGIQTVQTDCDWKMNNQFVQNVTQP